MSISGPSKRPRPKYCHHRGYSVAGRAPTGGLDVTKRPCSARRRERAQRRDGHAGAKELNCVASRRRLARRGVAHQQIQPQAHQAADARRRQSAPCSACWSPDARASVAPKTPQPTVASGTSVSAAVIVQKPHRGEPTIDSEEEDGRRVATTRETAAESEAR